MGGRGRGGEGMGGRGRGRGGYGVVMGVGMGGKDRGGEGRGRGQKREMDTTVRDGNFPVRSAGVPPRELGNAQLAPDIRCELGNSQLALRGRRRANWEIPSSHRRGGFRVSALSLSPATTPPYFFLESVSKREYTSLNLQSKSDLRWNRTRPRHPCT